MPDKSDLAKVAYDAYCDYREWKSVRGEPLPQWDKVDPGIQAAWTRSAEAVLKADCLHIAENLRGIGDALAETAKQIREAADILSK